MVVEVTAARRVSSLAACTIVAAIAVSTLPDWRATPTPRATSAPGGWTGTLTITPSTARPAQQITVTVPPGQTRRPYYVLARHGKPLYYLYSGDELAGPGWFSALDLDQYDLDQPARTDRGPDHLVIPPPAAPGSYELCTHNAPGKSCARLVIAG